MGCDLKKQKIKSNKLTKEPRATKANKHNKKSNKHIKNLRSKFLINLEQLTEILNKLDMLMADEHLNVVEAKFAVEQYKNYLAFCETKEKLETLNDEKSTIEEYLDEEKIRRMVV